MKSFFAAVVVGIRSQASRCLLKVHMYLAVGMLELCERFLMKARRELVVLILDDAELEQASLSNWDFDEF